jgi:hypothetical protein
MRMADLTRVEIGFDGGVIIGMKLEPAELARLEAALADGSDRISLAAEETSWVIDLRKLCYVKHERHVARVGF